MNGSHSGNKLKLRYLAHYLACTQPGRRLWVDQRRRRRRRTSAAAATRTTSTRWTSSTARRRLIGAGLSQAEEKHSFWGFRFLLNGPKIGLVRASLHCYWPKYGFGRYNLGSRPLQPALSWAIYLSYHGWSLVYTGWAYTPCSKLISSSGYGKNPLIPHNFGESA